MQTILPFPARAERRAGARVDELFAQRVGQSPTGTGSLPAVRRSRPSRPDHTAGPPARRTDGSKRRPCPLGKTAPSWVLARPQFPGHGAKPGTDCNPAQHRPNTQRTHCRPPPASFPRVTPTSPEGLPPRRSIQRHSGDFPRPKMRAIRPEHGRLPRGRAPTQAAPAPPRCKESAGGV